MFCLLIAYWNAWRTVWLSNGARFWLNARNWTLRNGPVTRVRSGLFATLSTSLKSIWFATSIPPSVSSVRRTVSSGIVVGDECQLDVARPALELERASAGRVIAVIGAVLLQRGRARDAAREYR